jgi:hypothetical protein
MFSLGLTKMNIHFDNFNISNLSPDMLNKMDYLHSYLEKKWTIKKRRGCYILTHDKNKILVSDTILFSNSLQHHTSAHTNHDDTNTKTKYILYFLYNVLNNGWTIKKSQCAEYIFIKKHEGKKEIFSNKYLHTFLKENFNSTLIK